MARKHSLHAIPEPWDYNPSKWHQRIRICLLAAVATLIAIYMGLYQWRLIDSVWDPIFGSQSMKVLDSELSHMMTGIIRLPDSILGALAYLGDIIFALAGSTRRWQDRPWLVIIFGLDVIPLGIVSAVLVFMQGFVVHYWCFLCLVTAVISLILVVLAYDEVWSCLLYLAKVYRRSNSVKILWKTFIGQPTDVGREVGAEMERGRDKEN